MVSDEEIAKGVESLLRASNPNVVSSLDSFIKQLELKLGLDLAHKKGFIKDHANFLLDTNVTKKILITTVTTNPQPQQQQQQAQVSGSETPKESTPTGTKRRGGAGGLNKVCGVTPELQAIVGESAMSRTQIVKQLWAYIRQNNLQDPSNKRIIICNDALRLLFETDSTDMFKMNKILSKHIIALEPSKEPGQASKRFKGEVESTSEITEASGSSLVIISDTLAKFFGSEGKEMSQSEAERRVWEYIRVNHFEVVGNPFCYAAPIKAAFVPHKRGEDPKNSMVIVCDPKLQELFGCESLSVLRVSDMLVPHFSTPS